MIVGTADPLFAGALLHFRLTVDMLQQQFQSPLCLACLGYQQSTERMLLAHSLLTLLLTIVFARFIISGLGAPVSSGTKP